MPSNSTPQIKACIFDMDGLLLDTESIYTDITNLIIAPYGKMFPVETKIKMMGREVKEATDILLSELQIPLTFEEYNDQATKLKEVMFTKAALMPGAERVIRHLSKHSIPIAVATSSNTSAFKVKTSNHTALFSLFNGNITCGDDSAVVNSKPAPDIFLTAMKRLGSRLQPKDCLVFEDSTAGLKAANNAEMSSVWVQDIRFTLDPSAPVLSHDATERILTLEDFDPTKFGLPPFED